MNNKPNKWLSLITIPFQMGFIIFIANRLGCCIDEKYQTDVYGKIITLLGVFIAMYQVIQQVNFINRNDK
ncbi:MULTISPECIES: AtpZ/AtpI family protein [Flavobacterium]|uniref:AtpZ/AtpI family protein n=1 Tax=Flavobacterium jumunjinense TaxID=998845 RepID=A0ABV5GR89_9FLAO|nr:MULTISPECIES: AtpZ/AtpI family protein [Flavobacterium]